MDKTAVKERLIKQEQIIFKCRINKNIKMSSFKSNESILNKEGGPDRFVSDNQSSSVTLLELAIKARKTYCDFEFQQ